MRGYDRLGVSRGGALLFQVLGRALASAFHAPVSDTIQRGIDKAKARLRPDPDGTERECRRKIQRYGDHGHADQVRADQIEVVNQRIGDNAAQQSLGGNHALPAHAPGQQSDEAGEESYQRSRADGLGIRRLNGPRAKPAQRIHRQEGRNQKRRDAEDLQRQVGDQCTEDANPIVRRTSGQRSRCGVQRRIERGVGNQGEDQEDREDEQQEADQLIEPPVGRRSECARTDIHFGVRSFCRSALARTHVCSIQRRQTLTSNAP